MAGGIIGAVVEAMMLGPEGMDYAAMSIAGVNPIDQSIMLPERTFQHWPETISDTIDIGWNFKDIPGASSALAQWASNAGRTITFEVHFHRFMKPVSSRSGFEKAYDLFDATTPTSQNPKDNRLYNVDVAAEIKYLRAFCYPSYKDIDSYKTSFPPPIAILAIPGLRLSDAVTGLGDDVIYAVMTGCDATYTLLFPDGTPRRASVSLTFRHILQDPISKIIIPSGFDQNKPLEGGVWDSKETPPPSPGGARKKNELPK